MSAEQQERERRLAELEHHLCTGDGRGTEAKRKMLAEYVALRAPLGEPVAGSSNNATEETP